MLTSHMNPDCDALGSEMALAEFLVSLGKEVAILNSDPTPDTFRFIDKHRRIKRYSSKRHTSIIRKAQVIIVLDASGGWKRLGQVGEALEQSPAAKLCIDHHPDSVEFVDVAVVDTSAAATGELVYELVQAMGGPLTKSMAQALYAAILTDTGSFRFPKTSSRTHHITAELIAAGANPLEIYRQIYEQMSLGSVQLKGAVLASIQTTADGRVAYYGLKLATLKAFGVKSSDLDGFASLGQQIKGVHVTVFCTEVPKERVKISLRSDGTVPINQIALEYNGGGHLSAAGALVSGKLEAVLAELVAKVTALVEAAPLPAPDKDWPG